MHADIQMRADPAARPLSDDWLYCDPEAICGRGEPDASEGEPVPQAARGSRFMALLEDLLLYLAGLSTGLVVVGMVVVFSDLGDVGAPAVAGRTTIHAQAGGHVVHVPGDIFVAPGVGSTMRP